MPGIQRSCSSSWTPIAQQTPICWGSENFVTWRKPSYIGASHSFILLIPFFSSCKLQVSVGWKECWPWEISQRRSLYAGDCRWIELMKYSALLTRRGLAFALACNQSHKLHKALGISVCALPAFTAFSPSPNFPDSTVEALFCSPGSTIVVMMVVVMGLSVICAVLLLGNGCIPFFFQSSLVNFS